MLWKLLKEKRNLPNRNEANMVKREIYAFFLNETEEHKFIVREERNTWHIVL